MSQLDSKPKIYALEHLKYTLPIGFKAGGKDFKTFSLGSIKGKLRRELTNIRNPHTRTITALCHALTQLGDIPYPGREFVEMLSAPDAEYINMVMTARRGNGLAKISVVCGDQQEGMEEGCGAPIGMTVDLTQVELQDGSGEVLFDAKGRPYQVVSFTPPATTPHVVDYRLPLLRDLELLSDKFVAVGREKPGDFLQHQISGLMNDWNQRGSGLSYQELDDLDFDVYDAMIRAAGKRYPPQVDKDVFIACPKCGRDHTVSLPVDQWLDPFAERGPSAN